MASFFSLRKLHEIFEKVSLDLSEGRGSSFSSEDSAAPASKPRAASLDTRLEVGPLSVKGGGGGVKGGADVFLSFDFVLPR